MSFGRTKYILCSQATHLRNGHECGSFQEVALPCVNVAKTIRYSYDIQSMVAIFAYFLEKPDD
jgi:hypothetical protein